MCVCVGGGGGVVILCIISDHYLSSVKVSTLSIKGLRRNESSKQKTLTKDIA